MFASKDLFFSKPSGYQISRSVRLRSSASAYFNRTPSVAGNQQKFTWSSWVKLGTLASNITLFSTNVAPSARFQIGTSSNAINVAYNDGTSWVLDVVTTAVYRDPSAWYHIVIYVDTTQATATNRVIIYVNGISYSYTGTNCPLNLSTNVNTAVSHSIGRLGNGTAYLDGYLTEVNFIDGQALTPSSFGQTNTVTGVWQPLKYTGTYGTNGFYLNFSDNSNNTATTIGKDYSGNGNNWTPNNISVTAGATYDSMLDVPTLFADGGNGRGNYCVMNPLNPDTISLNGSLTNGNLNASGTTYGVSVFSCTFQVPQSGKWYWETVYTTITNTVIVGIRSYSTSSTDVRYYSNGNKEVGGSTTAYGSSWTTNDVIGVAVDRDAGTVTFYKNNTSQGSINIPTNSAQFDITFNTTSPFGSTAMSVNFGQRPFTYTPPTGFVALNTQNLPTPTISNGANYMAATTYTGTGSALTIANTVNGISFQPDFVWVKGRSGATDHALYDSVRGTTKDLVSNSTAAETTQATGLTAFGSTGFTVGALAKMNTNAATYIGWQWLAGTTSSSNTAGSITSTVSVNATAGFSVVTYTSPASGAYTVGHGLGVRPSLVIQKVRNRASTTWPTWHRSLSNDTSQFLELNSTGATLTSAGIWGAGITSTTFGQTVGVSTASADTVVAYCFSEVAGYSKFGSYTGNGSADGPFVFCGFRPRFIMVKSATSVQDWKLLDTSRNLSNSTNSLLGANISAAEDTNAAYNFDILSNGFKIRNTFGYANTSGQTYIYMAFAENPTKFALAR